MATDVERRGIVSGLAARRRRVSWGRTRSWIQIGSSALFLGLFVLAATGAPRDLAQTVPVELYFLIDPLLVLTAWLTAPLTVDPLLAVALLVAGILLLGTAVFGRVFCGYLCPLGACLDWSAPSRRPKPGAFDAIRRWRWIGHALLAVLVVAAVAGVPLAYLFDPLAILWRGLALALYPLVLAASGLGLDGARLLLEQVSSTTPLAVSVPQRVFAGAAVSALLLGAILASNRLAPRLWCRTACPLGALLSLAGARPWLRRRVDADACLACTRCRTVCPLGAIDRTVDGGTESPPAECLVCLRCADACPSGAVSVRFEPPVGRRRRESGLRVLPPEPGAGYALPGGTLSRRSFLGGTACGLGGVLVLDRVPWPAGGDGGGTLRPPGIASEDDLLDRCVRCGVCMQACPTNVIQPDLVPAGVTGFFAPKIVMRLGGCDPECLRCGEVCPTGALRPLSPEAKKAWVFGTAVVDAERCARTAAADGVDPGRDVGELEDCRACVEVCPYEAFEPGPTPGAAPRVIAERCTGCGLCEFRCPVPSRDGGGRRARRAAFGERAAIRVVPSEEAARIRRERTPVQRPPRDDSYLPPFLRT